MRKKHGRRVGAGGLSDLTSARRRHARRPKLAASFTEVAGPHTSLSIRGILSRATASSFDPAAFDVTTVCWPQILQPSGCITGIWDKQVVITNLCREFLPLPKFFQVVGLDNDAERAYCINQSCVRNIH